MLNELDPATQVATLRFGHSGSTTIRVTNAAGQVMFAQTFEMPDASQEIQVQLARWPAGLYVVQLATATGQSQQKKLIVQ